MIPDQILNEKQDSNLRLKILVCFVLIILTAGVYWQVAGHEFVLFDDPTYITENPHVRTGMTVDNLRWAFTATHAYNWHPLTWLSHMLDCQLFGLNAGRHHLVNVLLHILNSVLLFLILNRMTKALWQSAFVAALFALHPLHVESVAWAAERKDVLSTLFWMLTMGAYVFYVEHPNTKRYLLTLSFFALGLMAKPMLVTLPFVLLLLDWWPLGRLKTDKPRKEEKKKRQPESRELLTGPYKWSVIRPFIGEKVPFFILSAISSAITMHAQQDAIGSLQSWPLESRISNALLSYIEYIGKAVWPQNLAIFYPYSGMPPLWQVLGATAVLVTVTYLTVRAMRPLAVGWLWYLGTLVPVIGLIQVGTQSMADRYTYIPLVGLAVMTAWGIPAALKSLQHRRIILITCTGILLCILSFITWKQLKYWQDSITLFEHTIKVTKDNGTAHLNLGVAFIDQGKDEEALSHLQEAMRINPGETKTYINLGHLLLKRGKPEKAVFCFHEALRIDPGQPIAHYNMGIALVSQGKIREAIFHFQEAVRKNPDYAEAHYNPGNAMRSEGRIEEAVAHFRDTLRIDPATVDAHNNLGLLLASGGKTGEAAAHFREAIRIKPNYATAYNNLGLILLSEGKTDEAVVCFQKALEIQPDNPRAKDNLKDALVARKRKVLR